MALSTAALLMPRRRRLSRNSMRPTLSSLDERADKSLLRFAGGRADSVPDVHARAGLGNGSQPGPCGRAPLMAPGDALPPRALRATSRRSRHLSAPQPLWVQENAPVQVPFTNLPPRRLNLVLFAPGAARFRLRRAAMYDIP